MKNKYTLKTFILAIFIALVSFEAFAQIRVVRVDPATNEVTIRNFGSANNPENIGTYWLCNFPNYGELEDMTVLDGSLNLAVGAEVTVTSSINFPVADAELGLYNDNSFSSPNAMEDYLQWGSAGHGRENVAVSAGLWAAGTFIEVAPPFVYNGNGSQNGVAFWETSLGTEGFETTNTLNIYPNPSKNFLNIQLGNNATDAKILIVDMLGKTVLKTAINTHETLDISALIPGVYLLKIESSNGSQTRQFIKR